MFTKSKYGWACRRGARKLKSSQTFILWWKQKQREQGARTVKTWNQHPGGWRGKYSGLGRGVVLSSPLLTPDDLETSHVMSLASQGRSCWLQWGQRQRGWLYLWGSGESRGLPRDAPAQVRAARNSPGIGCSKAFLQAPYSSHLYFGHISGISLSRLSFLLMSR